MEPGPLEIVRELLDPRLVGDSRERILTAGWPLRRVLAVVAVDLIEVLGTRVPGLELVVRDRPGRRDPVVVAKLTEILGSEPVQGGAVELGLAPDVVVDAGLEPLAPVVVPGLLGDVAVLDEDLVGIPVLDLPGQPVAAFEDEDPLSGWREMAGERAASGAAADNDHVEVLPFHHRVPPADPAVAAVAAVSSSSQTIRGVPLRSSASGARSLPK